MRCEITVVASLNAMFSTPGTAVAVSHQVKAWAPYGQWQDLSVHVRGQSAHDKD